MERCHTCVHWQEVKNRYDTIILPYRPDESYEQVENEAEAAKLFGHRVRYCMHPKVLFYQRPERDGAAVVDGSQYQAYLLTAEDFGCVLHTTQPIPPAQET